jgi:catechol-2,3-dioxygenase
MEDTRTEMKTRKTLGVEFRPLDPKVRIGHVHLKVADLERALGFYCGVLGFDLMQQFGNSAAFISAGGYHHHIGLNTWESAGGTPPPRGTTGLYHLAILFQHERAWHRRYADSWLRGLSSTARVIMVSVKLCTSEIRTATA